MTDLVKLARQIHLYAVEHKIYSITTWWGFAEIKDEWGFKEDENQLYKAIKKGQKLGLFSEGYWRGVGTTPWAGSARRARFYDVVMKNKRR